MSSKVNGRWPPAVSGKPSHRVLINIWLWTMLSAKVKFKDATSNSNHNHTAIIHCIFYIVVTVCQVRSMISLIKMINVLVVKVGVRWCIKAG